MRTQGCPVKTRDERFLLWFVPSNFSNFTAGREFDRFDRSCPIRSIDKELTNLIKPITYSYKLQLQSIQYIDINWIILVIVR